MVVLAYPVIDTLRVFTKRILKGVSPFTPDRNHIHHLLLELGFSHGKSTLLIVLCSIMLSCVAYALRETPTTAFATLVALILVVANIPSFILKRRKKSKLL
jgi:UDP-GlcNAc:undecaprenyl-phosphate GlcNAc-1-phosphate transferase